MRQDKDCSYYGQIREEILPLLPMRVDRLLDVGCGEGRTAVFLKEQGLCDWACGVEVLPGAAAIARKNLDLLIEGNIEDVKLSLDNDSIDVVLCLDVLEHLVDPWGVMTKLKKVLKPGGIMIASIPNVRHLRVLLPLIFRGRWTYVERGILDSTHLRFFTKHSAIELMKDAGLSIERMEPLCGKFSRLLRIGYPYLLNDFLAVQYLILSKKH